MARRDPQPDNEAPTRRYDASRRQAAARQSQRRIVAAAQELFEQLGYRSTSMAAIAEQAEVAVPTVYSHFPSKAALLRRAVEVALAGDDEPVSVAERPTAQWVASAVGAEELLRRYALMIGELAGRAGPMFAVLDQAADADAELAELQRTFEAQRLQAALGIARAVDERGGLPAGRTVEEAADLVWLVNAPDTYRLLVGRRGWTMARYVAWAGDALVQLILQPPGPPPPSSPSAPSA